MAMSAGLQKSHLALSPTEKEKGPRTAPLGRTERLSPSVCAPGSAGTTLILPGYTNMSTPIL